MDRTNFNELLEAGVHFGHLKRKWNPNMAPYIFMERNGIHIIDLYKTVAKIDEAASALKQIAKSGKKVLFVATKKQAKNIVAEQVKETNMPYVTERWPGGLLTNFTTFRKAVKKMSLIDKMTIDGTFENMSKKERLLLTRERAKLEKNLGSITDLTRIPSALFIIDVNKERIAVAEAKKLNIPTFAIVDTNSDPRNIDFIIPGNDDASNSISIIIKIMTQAITEGLNERKIDREKISEIENKKKIENRKNQETDKQEYSGKRKRIKSKVVKFEKKVSEQTKKTEKTLSVTAKKEISDKDSISKKTEENKTT